MFQLHQHRPDQLHQGVNINIRQEQQNIKTTKQRKEKTKNAFQEEEVCVEAGGGAGPSHINPHHRILRLEKNIAWLTEQHSIMLASLHTEIETLKNRNRELQFQLLMGGSSGIPPAATQDELELSGGGGSRSLALISHLSGVPPLQAEILDNEIKELQATLHEAKSRNVYLSNLVEQQKKKLALLEEEASLHVEFLPSPPPSADKTVSSPPSTPPTIPAEFLKKLAEAEELVNQLQRENSNQREELAAIKHTVERDARMKYRGCNHPARTVRHRLGTTTTSKSLDSRETSVVVGRARGGYRSVSTSKTDLRHSERFPPLKAMSVSRIPRVGREGEIQGQVLLGGGGSDSSINTVTSLPRLKPHSSHPALTPEKTRQGGKGRPAGRRLVRDTGPRYGSLDRKHSRS